MAKGSNTTVAGLTSTLKKKGVSMTTLRAQVEASMNLRWIISQKHKSKIEVNEAELDKRYKKLSSDPRLKPVTVYQLREVDLRVQNSGAMTQQLLYARAVEAQQIAKKYRGCNTLKAAAKGIFDVKVSGVVQAPADKMPAEMRKVLKKAGTKKLIGPMKVKTGIRMIAFCGIRKLKPPKPPREVVKNMMLNEKYEKATNRVMRDLRRRAFIEYKDKSATLTQ
jgi:peptidyl-prolyl cis-trans isomerase SurA